ncbi:MAG: hypothetical protein JW884_11660 [Deltaproteobacteria bacterium]|nr:hypothetical protein [Deltaproteobacteria bacterium]
MNKTASWFWFIAAGVAVFIIGGLHMAVIHLDGIAGIFNPAGGSSLAWENVSGRNGSLVFAVSYVILLGAALYHGLYGLYNIVSELGISEKANGLLKKALLAAGVALFTVGAYAAFAARFITVS